MATLSIAQFQARKSGKVIALQCTAPATRSPRPRRPKLSPIAKLAQRYDALAAAEEEALRVMNEAEAAQKKLAVPATLQMTISQVVVVAPFNNPRMGDRDLRGQLMWHWCDYNGIQAGLRNAKAYLARPAGAPDTLETYRHWAPEAISILEQRLEPARQYAEALAEAAIPYQAAFKAWIKAEDRTDRVARKIYALNPRDLEDLAIQVRVARAQNDGCLWPHMPEKLAHLISVANPQPIPVLLAAE